MKQVKMFLAGLLFFTLLSSASNAQDSKNLIVLVKYKAQPEKAELALAELKKLVDQVRHEPHYVNIVIHLDPADTKNILLYEEWQSEEYYKGDHMKTAHLQAFINGSRAFLQGPPEITFWKQAN